MGAVVAFCSQTGSAKRYADWLAEELGCQAVPLERIEATAADADLVVLCSWFHAASLKGAKRFQAYMAAHSEKHYAVVSVGATPMPSELWPASEHEEAFRRSFPAEAYPDLPWARKGDRRSATALAQMRAGYDDCERSYLEPLVTELRVRGWA